MKDNDSLDIDKYIKQMKFTSNTSRPWSMKKESGQSSFSKPKSAYRNRQTSPFGGLTKKLEKLQDQYNSSTQRNSTVTQGQISPIIQTQRLLSKVQVSKKHSSNQNFNIQSHYKVGVSKQQTKIFLQKMIKQIDNQSSSLSKRIQQFKSKIKKHIEDQYQVFKNTVLNYVEEIFNYSKKSFLLSCENKSTQLNASFYAIQQKLTTLSKELKIHSHSLQFSNWSKTLDQIDQIKITKQVQQLFQENRNLKVKQPILDLNREHLAKLESTLSILLNPVE